MRIRAGAVKINQHGGAIFVRENAAALCCADPLCPSTSASQLALIEVRNFVYRWLIERSPATRYHRELIAAPHGLLARGFQTNQLAQYGALPRTVRERDQMARELLTATGRQFPEHVSLRGVPGFWEDEHGVHLWHSYYDCAVRLLIPVRDEAGRIQACQLRNARTRGARYCWLSSAKLPGGTGSGSPLHFNFELAALPRSTPIFVIEGFLKADALAALRRDTTFIATGGAAANHAALIQHTHGRPVVVAYDQDYRANETVCRHLAALLAARIVSEGQSATTRVATWPSTVKGMKGIDDAALRGLPLQFTPLDGWLQQLSPTNRAIIAEAWQARGLALPA